MKQGQNIWLLFGCAQDSMTEAIKFKFQSNFFFSKHIEWKLNMFWKKKRFVFLAYSDRRVIRYCYEKWAWWITTCLRICESEILLIFQWLLVAALLQLYLFIVLSLYHRIISLISFHKIKIRHKLALYTFLNHCDNL